MRILLVEDNAMNATFVTEALEPEGHEVVPQATGPQGLATALVGRFDLILLDIELPGLPGDAICRQLRAAGVRTPVVALTAAAMPDQLAGIRTAGFDEIITKPVPARQLRAMARRFDHP